MRTVHVEVTQKDCDEGILADSECCPIALAMQRISTGIISVGQSTVRFYKPQKFYRAYLPQEAREFVAKFDAEQDVAPFAFDIEIPEEA
jgi:hypothetical protein